MNVQKIKCNGVCSIKSMEHLSKNIKLEMLNDIDDLVLFYEGEDGRLYPQKASEVSEVGGLIDLDTDEDMPVIGWLVIRDA